MPRIICVVGPTATGKTKLAVRLCQEYNGEVVSCDSMQLYRGMVIGTAAPTAEEMAGVPHHMIGVVDPREDFSVGRYVEQADAQVQDILSRGKTVVIAGGTGLYVDSLIAGRDFAPYPQTGRREALERELAERGIEPLLDRLRDIDPDSAARLHPANQRRILRALEIYEETGVTMTEHDRRTREIPPKYAPLWIGLDYADRADLNARIDRRVDQMFDDGLEREVAALLASGVPQSATAMQAIGYKEPAMALRGEITMDEAREQVKLGSRRYAKRQRTWFRRNAAIHWQMLPSEPNFDEVFAAVRRLVTDFDGEAC
jgi:tRNA dimethylallyltransferase